MFMQLQQVSSGINNFWYEVSFSFTYTYYFMIYNYTKRQPAKVFPLATNTASATPE